MWMLLLITVGAALLTSLFTPTQKAQTAKAGTIDDFDFPQIEDGSPVFYVAGRVRLNGPNLTWYGDFKSEPIRVKTQKSTLFTKAKYQTTGHKYFLGMQLCICTGPKVRLRQIWFGGDDPAWVSGGAKEPNQPTTRIQVFKDANYQSKMLSFVAAEPDLNTAGQGLNDGISSIKAWGEWEVFVDAYYQGNSMIVEGDIPNLAGSPFQDKISSLRPVHGPSGSGGWNVGPGIGETLGFKMTDLEAFGGEDGSGGYDITVDFYEGSFTQMPNAYMEQKAQSGSNLVSGFRGVSYLVMHGYIGNTTQVQNVSVEVDRVPDPLGLGAKAIIGTEGDVNPANVLYELLTEGFVALPIQTHKINRQSFVNAGHIFFDEDEGISISAGGSAAPISNTFQDILKQVDGVMYEDPEDGQVHLKLIRADFNIDDLPRLNPSNITEMASYAINLWADTKNKVRVNYKDRQKNYEERSAVAEDMANVAFQQSQSKPVNTEHKFVKRGAHANRIAARELAIYSTPLANIRLASLRFELGLRPGAPVVIDYPEYNISDLVVRVTKVDLGDLENNRLLLDLTGDKFARSNTVYAPPGSADWTRPYVGGKDINHFTVMEAPRWFAAQAGEGDSPRLLAAAATPGGGQQGFRLFAAPSAAPDADRLVIPEGEFTPCLTLTAPLAASYSAGGVIRGEVRGDDEGIRPETLENLRTGLNLVFVGGEILGFTEATFADGAWSLTGLRRGLLDTTPKTHAAGDYLYWLDAQNLSIVPVSPIPATAVISASAIQGSQTETTGVPLSIPESRP